MNTIHDQKCYFIDDAVSFILEQTIR